MSNVISIIRTHYIIYIWCELLFHLVSGRGHNSRFTATKGLISLYLYLWGVKYRVKSDVIFPAKNPSLQSAGLPQRFNTAESGSKEFHFILLICIPFTVVWFTASAQIIDKDKAAAPCQREREEVVDNAPRSSGIQRWTRSRRC